MCVEKIMIMFFLIKNGICFMTRGDILRWFILIKLAKTIFFLNIHSKVKVLFRRRYERRFTYS